MKQKLNHSIVFLSLLLCAALFTSHAFAENRQTRNAVYNGDFLQGLNGWNWLGPGRRNVNCSLERSQYGDQLYVDILIQSSNMRETFSFFHTPLLQIKPAATYEVIFEASGTGDFMFGAFEYNAKGRHVGNNYSERLQLTPEAKEYRFTYRPGATAVGIRPAIAFLPSTEGQPTDLKAHIKRMEIPVSDKVFPEITAHWPVDPLAEKFKDYAGFSAEELAELQEVADIDVVLPPYRPITVNAPGDFTLTTSRLHFGNRMLPERIDVLEKQILAQPMELRVELEDGTQLNQFPVAQPVMRATDTKVVLEQKFNAGNVEMTVALTLEYDALMLYHVAFKGPSDAGIKHASLVISLHPDAARYIRYNDYSRDAKQSGVFGYGPIPSKGEIVRTKAVIGSEYLSKYSKNDWNPMVPSDDDFVWTWNRGYLNTLWLGDEYRGLSMMSLNQKGYSAGQNAITARIDRKDEAVKLTYTFITEKTTLGDGRELQFGLQIMPPKQVRKNWLSSRYGNFFSTHAETMEDTLDRVEEQMKKGVNTDAELPLYGSASQLADGRHIRPWKPTPYRKYRDMGGFWHSVWSVGCCSPIVENPDWLKRAVQISDQLGHLLTPYFAATHIASEDPAGYYYVVKTGEWEELPSRPRTSYLRPTCPVSMFSAYIAHGIGKMIDEYGISGVYFDNSAPVICHNPAHGCGYSDESGKAQGTLSLLGMRKLYMMVRHEFVKRGIEPNIRTHLGLDPCTVSFIDAVVQGEGIYGSDHTEMFTLGEWRAAWLGKNQYGVEMSYLAQLGYGIGPGVNVREEQRIGTPRLMMMGLLHGTHVRAGYNDKKLVVSVWEVLDAMSESPVTFIPYWEWDGLNQLINDRKIFASAYKSDDQLVLVLANLATEEQHVSFPLAEIQTKNRKTIRVSDHMHGLPVSIKDGCVTCTIPAKNFRLLTFEQ